MEGKAEYKEGVESFRKRIIHELQTMEMNIDGFVDGRNKYSDIRHLVQTFRRSIDKVNLYLSEIEVLNERTRNGDNEASTRDDRVQP